MKWAKPKPKQKRKLTVVFLTLMLAMLIAPFYSPSPGQNVAYAAGECPDGFSYKENGYGFTNDPICIKNVSSADKCTVGEYHDSPNLSGVPVSGGYCAVEPNESTDTGNGGGNTEDSQVAEGSGGVECFDYADIKDYITLNWVFCPLANTMAWAAQKLDDNINSWLCIDQKVIFGRGNICGESTANNNSSRGFHRAWNVFRVFALGIIAIAGLVMIISQAAGLEIFDAYSIRKVLPRLMIAAIGVSLSWQILQFLVSFSNVLGIGIRHIIYAPFIQSGVNLNISLTGGATSIGSIALLGGLAALGILGMLSFVLTALLAILVAFIVLAFRNILIFMLVILAPLAIACYVLPNTQKIWKIWWNWLFMGLMAFPIIEAFIASGRVFAGIAATAGGLSNNIMAFFAYFLPYFLLPFAFRLAGGAIGTIGGMVNDRSRGGFDRLRGFRGKQRERLMEKNKEGRRFGNARENSLRGKLNKGAQVASTAPQWANTPDARRWGGNIRNTLMDTAKIKGDEVAFKDPEFDQVAGDTDLMGSAISYGHHRNGDQLNRDLYLRKYAGKERLARFEAENNREMTADDVTSADISSMSANDQRSLKDDQSRISSMYRKHGDATQWAFLNKNSQDNNGWLERNVYKKDASGNFVRDANGEKIVERTQSVAEQAYNAALEYGGGDQNKTIRAAMAIRANQGRAGRGDVADVNAGTLIPELQKAMSAAGEGKVGELSADQAETIITKGFMNKDAVDQARQNPKSVKAKVDVAGKRINQLTDNGRVTVEGIQRYDQQHNTAFAVELDQLTKTVTNIGGAQGMAANYSSSEVAKHTTEAADVMSRNQTVQKSQQGQQSGQSPIDDPIRRREMMEEAQRSRDDDDRR